MPDEVERKTTPRAKPAGERKATKLTASANPDRAALPAKPGKSAAPATTSKPAASTSPAAVTALDDGPSLSSPSLYINRELSLLEFFSSACSRRRTTPPTRCSSASSSWHRGLEPRRVLHGPRRRPAAAGRGRRRPRSRPTADTAAAAAALAQRGACELMTRGARTCFSELLPRARRGRHPHPRLRELDADAAAPPLDALLRRAGLPGAHAARLRPGPAVPAHLQPEPQPRRAACATQSGEERFARVKVPDTLPRLVPVPRAGGAAAPGRATAPRSSTSSGSSRSSPPTSDALPGMESSSRTPSASPATPSSRSRSWRPRPARDDRAGRAPAAVRLGRARDRRRRRCPSASATSSRRTSSSTTDDVYTRRAAAGHEQPLGRCTRSTGPT